MNYGKSLFTISATKIKAENARSNTGLIRQWSEPEDLVEKQPRTNIEFFRSGLPVASAAFAHRQ